MQQEKDPKAPVEDAPEAPVVNEPADDESEDVEPMGERQSDHA